MGNKTLGTALAIHRLLAAFQALSFILFEMWKGRALRDVMVGWDGMGWDGYYWGTGN